MTGFRTGRPDISRIRSGSVSPSYLIRIFPSLPTLSQQGTGSVSGVTCTRASTRSCAKSDGTLVVLSSNQVAVEPNGILCERGTTNRVEQSQSPVTSPWIVRGTASITNNAATAPDGTVTAALVSGLDAVGTADFYQLVSGFTASTAVWPSFWVKRVSTTGLFSVSNSSAGGSGGLWIVNVALLPDAWTRIVPGHPALTITTAFAANVGGAGGPDFFCGTGAPLSFYVWGIDVEQPTPTSTPYTHAYVPTTSGLATSADDVITIANPLSGTGSAFSFGVSFTPSYGRTWESRPALNMALWQLGAGNLANSISMVRDTAGRVQVTLADGTNTPKIYVSTATLMGATTKRVVFSYVPGTGGSVTIDGVNAGGSWSGVGTGIVTLASAFTMGRNYQGGNLMLDGHIYNITMTP
jgi:hypothetical protein